MRTLWAIADLHLPLATPTKDMGLINARWKNYIERLASNWKARVQPQDVVVVAGDISWAMHLQSALIDLAWLDQLPGTKILMRGNHDFWWESAAKLARDLPPSCLAMTGPAIRIDSLAFAGARLWTDDQCAVGNIFVQSDYAPPLESERDRAHRQLILKRELGRLERSLRSLPRGACTKIAITHFPPIGTGLIPTRASTLMQQFDVRWALFGHLHNVQTDLSPFGHARGIDFELCSADYLDFAPKKILCF